MLLRSIYWYFTFAATLAAYVPLMYAAKAKKPTMEPLEYNRYIHRRVSQFGLGCVKRTGAHFQIEGMENVPRDEPVVFISNHQGNFDIAVFLAHLPVPHGYVAKIELLKAPMIRTWMKYMHCVFLDRNNMRQSAKAIIEGIKILQGGQSLVIFPEGTRSKSEKMGEFKAASFKLATKAKVPIVPVTINGTFRIMETEESAGLFRNKLIRLIRPANVYVKIHPPIRTDGLDAKNSANLPVLVRQIIEDGLKNSR